jgi:hypothetical protein
MHRYRRREHGATSCNGRRIITSTERVQSMTFVVNLARRPGALFQKSAMIWNVGALFRRHPLGASSCCLLIARLNELQPGNAASSGAGDPRQLGKWERNLYQSRR